MKITPIAAPSGPFDPHPFCSLLPRMSKEDFLELIADILDNGLQQPIILYQSKILDGNHRYNACAIAKKKPSFAEFDGSETEAQAFATTGADGKKRKRKSSNSKSRKLAHETVSFYEVTNASTALNAYKTLQERLLDALSEVHDYTDLSQAEESGRRTIEMIEEKLSELQPEEEKEKAA